MKRITLLALAAGLALTAQTATAAVSTINSEAALGTTDTVDWLQLGAAVSTFSTPASWTSTNGATGTISASAGQLQRRDEGNGWVGDFLLGDHLIFQPNSESALGTSEPVTIRFDSAVFGFGSQFQSDNPGAFEVRMEAFDAAALSLGSFVFSGISNGGSGTSNGVAPFFGLLSDAANIASVRILTVLLSAPSSSGYSFNQLRLNTGEQVPEPATMSLLGLGLAGLGWRRRRTA